MSDDKDKGPWATPRSFADLPADAERVLNSEAKGHFDAFVEGCKALPPHEFEQQPFPPEATDDQIIGLARERYGTDVIEVDTDATVHRGDAGAWVEAVVFVPKDEIEQHGAYVPTAEEEDTYLPGPHMHALLTGARAEFVDDIMRGCDRALDEHAEPRDPLWQRIATSFFPLICMGVVCFALGHGAGYKEGVHDVVEPIATALKVQQ